jgi:hypothetical protein
MKLLLRGKKCPSSLVKNKAREMTIKFLERFLGGKAFMREENLRVPSMQLIEEEIMVIACTDALSLFMP